MLKAWSSSTAIVFTLLAACGLTSRADACDLCAVYNASAAHGTAKSGFFAAVAEQYTHYGTLQRDGKEIHDPFSQRMESSITQVIGGYNINDRIGLQLSVPLIHRSFRRPVGGRADTGSESGLGDVSLFATVTPLLLERRHVTLSWNVIGGIKLPTGDTDRLGEEAGGHHDDEPEELQGGARPKHEGDDHSISGVHGHDLALGSGSVDGLIGTGLFARWKRLMFDANVHYMIRTKGDFDYRYGNDLLWNGGPGVFLLLSEEQTFAIQLVASGERKGEDRVGGSRADDTAMTSVMLGPMFHYTWSDKLSLVAGVELPLHHDNTGLQMAPDWRLRGAATWRF